jgi:hypothetical protein
MVHEAQQGIGQVAKKALPASGSPEAAKLAGIRFVNVFFGVPSEKVEAIVSESTASSALVRAIYLAQQCDLTLVKNATVNEYGWAVQFYKCQNKP